MRPLVFHDSIAEILFIASVVLVSGIESAVRRRSRLKDRGSHDWTLVLIGLVTLISLAVATYAAAQQVAPLPGGRWWPVIAGLILIWIGFAVRIWSIVTLGRFFQLTVVVQADHKVVDRGPYRWLRHPSYLGIIVTNTGVGLAEGDWVSVAVMLFGTLAVFLVRIRVEERALLGKLGDQYATYASRTARLVPGVY
jgi:protein-S-isoprenylcysteine O-methyltransferase Ste14